jgi:membrane dipeptidase
MKPLSIVLLFCLAGIVGPLPAQGGERPPASPEKARMMAQGTMLIDTHIDVPYRLEEGWVDVTRQTPDGDFDYQRARRGGLDVPFMSIYTPAESEEEGTSFEIANRLIDRVEALAGRAPEKFAVVRTADQAEQARQAGLMGLAMGMENGSPLEGKLENVAFFRERGISYITLAHSLSNHISDSSYDENRTWNGLSPFGREVVAEMNRVGVMIDVSHVTDEAFNQVLELSEAPVIASHSSARHFTPGWERNMSDEMIVRLAGEGGVIMINYGSAFLNEEARAYGNDRRAFLRAAREADPDLDDEHFTNTVLPEFVAQNGPYPYATLDDVLDHIDHVVALTSVDAVGIGSDYDGVGDSLPAGLKDVSSYPNLVRGLLERGYSEEDVRKILGENLLRVWSAVEAYAEAQAGA